MSDIFNEEFSNTLIHLQQVSAACMGTGQFATMCRINGGKDAFVSKSSASCIDALLRLPDLDPVGKLVIKMLLRHCESFCDGGWLSVSLFCTLIDRGTCN